MPLFHLFKQIELCFAVISGKIQKLSAEKEPGSLRRIRYFLSMNNQDGVVLVLSLMILGLLSMLATTVAILTTTDLKISNNYFSMQGSFLASETGIEVGRDALLNSIRVNNDSWNQILAQNSNGNSAVASSETLYSLNSGVWDSATLTNNTPLSSVYVSGVSGPSFSLTIKDNNDGDGDYTKDTDFIVILESTGSSGNSSAVVETTVACPVCEGFYSQERYSPESPGSLSTQASGVQGSSQVTIN